MGREVLICCMHSNIQILFCFKPSKTGIREVIAIFWTINDPNMVSFFLSAPIGELLQFTLKNFVLVRVSFGLSPQ